MKLAWRMTLIVLVSLPYLWCAWQESRLQIYYNKLDNLDEYMHLDMYIEEMQFKELNNLKEDEDEQLFLRR